MNRGEPVWVRNLSGGGELGWFLVREGQWARVEVKDADSDSLRQILVYYKMVAPIPPKAGQSLVPLPIRQYLTQAAQPDKMEGELR